jgi:hypothetical protein
MTRLPDFINQIPDRYPPSDGADGQVGRPGSGCERLSATSPMTGTSSMTSV